MFSVLARRGTLREACVALALGAIGTLFQLACGGGSHPPPAPVITSFTAAKSPITTGTSTTLTAVFSNGTGSVSGSVGTVTSGTAATVSPTVDTTYTLTVTNSAGVAVTATAPVAVVAAPVAASLVAAKNPVPYGGTTTLTPTFSGGTGSVDQSVGAVTSGTAFGSGLITAAKTFLLTVTNAAGAATTTSVSLTPQTVSVGAITPAASNRTVGTSTTFSAAATGGATNTLTWSASAGTMNPATGAWTAPSTAQVVSITATSVDDGSKSASSSVAVVAAPVAASLVAAKNPVPYGGTTTLTPTFSGGTGSVDQSVGAVTSGTAFGSGLITAAKTFLLTVTNAAGAATTTSVSLTPQTVSVGAITPAASNRTVGTSTTFSAAATGGATNTLTWSASAGTMNPTTGAWTAPSTAQVVSITAISVDDASKFSTTSVAVAAMPLLPVISAPTTVIANTTGNSASLTAPQGGMTFSWTITGGSITSATTGTNVTFTANGSGALVLRCTATNAAGTVSAEGTASSTIVPAAPTVPVISAPSYVSSSKAGCTASLVSPQLDMTFAWTITNGSFTSAATGSSVTFTPAATGTVILRCIATNTASVASTAGTATSAIVPYATISTLSASPGQVASGGAATLSYTFFGGTGAIDHGVGAIVSGGTSVVHPTATTTYTLTVTNLAGDITTNTVLVTVPPLPVISSFKAASATITAGQGTLLSFSFTGVGAIDQAVGPVSSGGQFVVTPAMTTTYTLTATNVVGVPVTASVTVTVKAFTGKFVYVANSGGGVSAYKLNDATGVLTESVNSPFDETITALHVTTDPAGKFLFVVNGDGVTNLNTLTVYTIDPATGDLTLVKSYATGVDPWTCAVDPTGKWVYVRCDGSISAFSLNATTGVLTPLATPSIPTAGGSGSVLIHPSGTLLFTVGRTSDQLHVFALDPATGSLSPDSTYSLPAGTGPLSLALSHTGEYLFTKNEGASGSVATDCLVYGFHVNVISGGLIPLAPFDTHLQNSDAYHGVSGNPTQSVIYITLVGSTSDYAAYAFNLLTGTLTSLPAATYDLFGATGSDNLVVSRNGKWAFITDYTHAQIAVGTVDQTTGVITAPTFKDAGQFPVSIAVVGSIQ